MNEKPVIFVYIFIIYNKGLYYTLSIILNICLVYTNAYYAVFLIFLVFCVVILCVFTFWVPCCDVRYDFRIKTMFGPSLPSVVCRRAHVLYTLFVFVVSNTYCVVSLFCFSLSMLPVSLDCPFLIVPSVFSTVYLC
jgi:hypothetical protein